MCVQTLVDRRHTVILCGEKRELINDTAHGMLRPWCHNVQNSEESKQYKEKFFFL